MGMGMRARSCRWCGWCCQIIDRYWKTVRERETDDSSSYFVCCATVYICTVPVIVLWDILKEA